MTYRKKSRKKRLRYPPEMAALAWKSVGEREWEAMRNAIRSAWEGDLEAVKRAVDDMAVARMRARRKAERDARTDVRKRVLVGARLPREKGEEVKKCAARTGRSVYRFVCDAIQGELDKYTEVNPPEHRKYR